VVFPYWDRYIKKLYNLIIMMETKILVVEDEALVAEDIKKTLQDLGYAVLSTASSGEEAIKKVNEYRPDLVLMDIVLQGGMDGVETAKQISSHFNTPIIYLTAYSDKTTLERARITEPFGYIIKPFKEKELKMAIDLAIFKHDAEKKLKESKEWLFTTLASISDAVIATDPKGCVEFMNPVAQSLTGWEIKEVLGKPTKDILNILNGKNDAFRRFYYPVSGAGAIKDHQAVLISRNKLKIPVEISISPIKDDRGGFVGNVIVLRDITERKLAEEALKESEERFRSLVESAPNAVVITDCSGNIISWNKSAEKIFLYTEKEVLGKPLTILMPNRYRDAHQRGLERVRLTGKSNAIGKPVELHGLRKDSSEFPLELSLSTWSTEKGSFYGGIIHDITERKRTEEALSWESNVNVSIAELSTALILMTTIDETPSLVLEYAKHLTGSKFGYTGYIDSQTGYLISPTLSRDIWDICNIKDKNVVFKKFTGLFGWVLNNGKPLLTNAPDKDPRSSGTPEGHVPILRFLSVPAMIDETLVGQISVANSDHDYTERDLRLLERLATIYAIALQRKKIEEALQKSETRLKLQFERMPIGCIVWSSNLRIEAWNPAAEKIFGFKADEVLGKHPYDLIVPKDGQPHLDTIWHRLLEGDYTAHSINKNITKDKRIIICEWTNTPLKVNDTVIGVLSMVQDITERKRAEEELKESEDRYRRLIDFSPFGIAIHSDQRFIYVNFAAMKILGATEPEELVGKPALQFIHLDYHGIVKERISKEEQGEIAPLIEEKFLRLDGTSVDVEIMSIPFTHKGKLAMYGVFQEITERKKAEEEINNSLKEKEILLREIHHRVKNNMQIISSLLKLQSGYTDERKYRDIFKDCQNRIASMALIHEKLYQSVELTKIDLDDYIRNLVNSLFQSYDISKGTITLNIDIEKVSLGIDLATPCGLIISELVSNSLKHAFPNGREGGIKVAFRQTDENTFELTVNDNGIGIPEDMDFRKTESLGLSLFTMLVEDQLEGEISLDRSKGTEFRIKFKGGN